MKRAISILIAVAFAGLMIVSVTAAGTIKPSGMSQKDLYNLLNNIVTKHNALFADYTSTKKKMRTSYVNYSTVAKRVGPAPAAGGLSLTQ